MVPVPKRYVMQVYGFIMTLAGQEQAGDEDTAESKDEKWMWLDDEYVERAWDESTPSMRTILTYLAAREDEWVPMADLVKQLGPDADPHTVAGTLGAFTRRCETRYGHATWPFDAEPGAHGAGASYRMEARYAARYQGR
jgi:hypothetical protein